MKLRYFCLLGLVFFAKALLAANVVVTFNADKTEATITYNGSTSDYCALQNDDQLKDADGNIVTADVMAATKLTFVGYFENLQVFQGGRSVATSVDMEGAYFPETNHQVDIVYYTDDDLANAKHAYYNVLAPAENCPTFKYWAETLTEAKISKHIHSLAKATFVGMKHLNELTIPSNIEAILWYAIENSWQKNAEYWQKEHETLTLKYLDSLIQLGLMKYVDEINMTHGGEGTKLYSTADSQFKKICMQNKLMLLDASVRHLGTDKNYVVLENLFSELKDKADFFFRTPVQKIAVIPGEAEGDDPAGYRIFTAGGEYTCRKCIVSVGRSGSKWMEEICKDLKIPTQSNRVDLGVRVELPAPIFSHITDELYESKIVYRTEKFEDRVRTFCMNPRGSVVNENTNGIITVNGHSYEDPEKQTDYTNFALLVSKHFSVPFKDSNGYGESIARLSNMLGGGVIVQRFGDLIRGRRTNHKRLEESFVTPTLKAEPGDLSLVLPKRILDGIIEMIYALDKIAPGTANDDTPDLSSCTAV